MTFLSPRQLGAMDDSDDELQLMTEVAVLDARLKKADCTCGAPARAGAGTRADRDANGAGSRRSARAWGDARAGGRRARRHVGTGARRARARMVAPGARSHGGTARTCGCKAEDGPARPTVPAGGAGAEGGAPAGGGARPPAVMGVAAGLPGGGGDAAAAAI